MFQQINGPVGSYNFDFGNSLDLSHDSSTLVVGALYRSVYIYDYNNVTSEYDLFHTTAYVDAREVCVSSDRRKNIVFTDLSPQFFVVMTYPLHQLHVRKRSSSSCYIIEAYNTHDC